MKVCFYCHRELKVPNKVGFRDTCPHCGSDLHVCLNCRYYDRHSYNECQEPQADRVVEKDKANFCEYFTFRDSGERRARLQEAAEAKAKLNELFKKLG